MLIGVAGFLDCKVFLFCFVFVLFVGLTELKRKRSFVGLGFSSSVMAAFTFIILSTFNRPFVRSGGMVRN